MSKIKENNSNYEKIYKELKKSIQKGRIKEFEKLPTEMQLCETYSVSRITVRKALEKLEQDNLIQKFRGKGTFVTPFPIVQNKSGLNKLFDDIKNSGKTPYSKILSIGIFSPTEDIQEKMEVSNEKILIIEWIRYADNEPILYEKIHFLADKVQGLEKIDLSDKKLYDILEKKYGVTFEKGVEKFRPCILTEDLQRVMKIKNCNLGMEVEKKLWFENRIFEYTLAYIRGDRFIYTTEYKK
ncbi:GntR family transcriptional regulator [Cetobacterium sp.]|uniref:GntR family transcriptional regulator n=1 Tax=Cetobacterium sp. TaxID=2071632 RepID=UPI003AF0A1F4